MKYHTCGMISTITFNLAAYTPTYYALPWIINDTCIFTKK